MTPFVKVRLETLSLNHNECILNDKNDELESVVTITTEPEAIVLAVHLIIPTMVVSEGVNCLIYESMMGLKPLILFHETLQLSLTSGHTLEIIIIFYSH